MPARSLRRHSIIARKLRADSTDAERILWRALRERLPFYKFRRQHPVGDRVTDFACPEKKIVIEIDGSQHADETQADGQRSFEIASHGYRVIRFWNNDVIKNLVSVLETIDWELETTPPHPTLSAPKGRRGKLIDKGSQPE
jgi:very-short-patch-repair endonuclease